MDIKGENAGIWTAGETRIRTKGRGMGAHWTLFLRCAYYGLSMTGLAFSLNTAFDLGIFAGAVGWAATAAALLLAAAGEDRRINRIVRAAYAAGCAAAALLMRGTVAASFRCLAAVVGEKLRDTYGLSDLFPSAAAGATALPALLLIFLALTFFLAGPVVRGARTRSLLQTSFAVLGLILASGGAFELPGVFLTAGGLLALASMAGRGGPQSQRTLFLGGLQMGVCLILLSVLIGGWAAPRLYRLIEPWNQRMNQKLTELTEQAGLDFGAGSAVLAEHASSAGDVLGNYPPEYDGEVDVRILATEKPRQNVYLRGFVGDTYQKTRWSESDGTEFEQGFPDAAEALSIQNGFYSYIASRAKQEASGISVDAGGADDTYAYVPYGVPLADGVSVEGDATAYSQDRVLSYTGYVNWSRWVEDGVSENEPDELETRYQEYVSSQYLKVPAEGLDRLKAWCEENKKDSVQEVIDFVVPELANGREYSLDLEEVPEDEDFAEYFFFEQKKGYCIHFATTATLIFRLMGVPARYVTGYVATADSFVSTDGGYAAELTDRQAHAWVEVYRKGKGWEPIEVTPGFDGEGGASAGGEELSETETASPSVEAAEETPTPAQEEEPTDELQETPDETGETGQAENTEEESAPSGAAPLFAVFLLLFAALFLAAAAVFAGCRACRARIRRKRHALFYQKNRNKAVCEIARGAANMLRDAGAYPADAEELDDLAFAGAAEAACPGIAPGSFLRLVRTARGAAFGREDVGQEAWEESLRFYRGLEAYLDGRMQGRRRLWWKYKKGYGEKV